MSVEAAAVFDISQADLLKFLDEAQRPEIVTPTGKYFSKRNQNKNCLKVFYPHVVFLSVDQITFNLIKFITNF